MLSLSNNTKPSPQCNTTTYFRQHLQPQTPSTYFRQHLQPPTHHHLLLVTSAIKATELTPYGSNRYATTITCHRRSTATLQKSATTFTLYLYTIISPKTPPPTSAQTTPS
ncbi:hypothetical protein HanRHA438_Chr16g0753301 [Helianthus annuus]|nr:hypothetical protein HanIR_Chr16g0805951 [Helianthus annuus]KAJ0835273.1 hypothetical protein HanRHA438_Chr16g0753301 [Helianthus annuus]